KPSQSCRATMAPRTTIAVIRSHLRGSVHRAIAAASPMRLISDVNATDRKIAAEMYRLRKVTAATRTTHATRPVRERGRARGIPVGWSVLCMHALYSRKKAPGTFPGAGRQEARP